MRRLIAFLLILGLAVVGIILVAMHAASRPSGPSHPSRASRPGLHVTPKHLLTACAPAGCGHYGATLTWGTIPRAHTTTGYYVFLSSVKVADVTGTSYSLTNLDCGTTYQLGVQAHDSRSSTKTSQAYTTSYTTPTCPAVNTFCTIPAAYTNLDTGPHLCGWPDSTNTGYENAPGYPGSLTVASSGSSSCPTTPQSNHTYSYCQWSELNLPANLTNVTFYGDDFYTTHPQYGNVAGGHGDNNITFDYDTFQPQQAAPPVSCNATYEYGIYNESGQIGALTVEHSDFWGFGNAIDTEGSTQANPQVFKYNWLHDAVENDNGFGNSCGYHVDGIGMLDNGTEDYAVVDHNTFEFEGNSNEIAWQDGTYAHDQNTNNLLSGDNEAYAGGRCTSSCTAPSYIQTTGNTYSTYLAVPTGDYPIDNATNFWSGTGDVWNHNYWAIPSAPPGAPPPTTATTGSPPPTAADSPTTAASSAKPTGQTPPTHPAQPTNRTHPRRAARGLEGVRLTVWAV